LALAYLIFLAIVGTVGGLIGSVVADQATAFAKQAPDMLARLQLPAPGGQEPNSFEAQAIETLRSQLVSRSSELLNSVPQYLPKILAAAGELIYVIIIPILGFFFLKDAKIFRQHALDLVEGRSRELLNDLMADVHLLLAHYMRALVGLSLVAFAAYSIFFSILGMPYALLLAAIGGAFEFIPMLGPLAAAVVILLVAGVSGMNVIPVLIFLGAFRIVQDYVISPQLMGQGVELHPLLVIFGVFAGAEIAGIRGAFLSVPLLAMSRVFYVRLRRRLGTVVAPGAT
jgi:predicted PurR-regulated permease PerM